MKADKKEVTRLLPKAIELAKVQKASGSTITVALLQRKMGVGYVLGYYIIKKMEELGYVGPFDGARGREIYL